MKKELTVGKNYGGIFGLPDNKQMVYNGGISWTAIDGTQKPMTMDSQKTTDNALEYINRPSYKVGQ